MSDMSETARRLRVLLAHIESHPELPDVASAGTDFGKTDLEIHVSGGRLEDLFAWSETLDAGVVTVEVRHRASHAIVGMVGTISGEPVNVFGGAEDLPSGDWSAPMPLSEFRAVLDRLDWIPGGDA